MLGVLVDRVEVGAGDGVMRLSVAFGGFGGFVVEF
jgi:hypothetical protein